MCEGGEYTAGAINEELQLERAAGDWPDMILHARQENRGTKWKLHPAPRA